MAIIKKQTKTDKDVEVEPLCFVASRSKKGAGTLENRAIPQKAKQLPSDLAILF